MTLRVATKFLTLYILSLVEVYIMSRESVLLVRLIKQQLNSVYGRGCKDHPLFNCRRCGKKFNGKIYQVRIPTVPIDYGSDDSPVIQSMYPHLTFVTIPICNDCHEQLLAFMDCEQSRQNDTEGFSNICENMR